MLQRGLPHVILADVAIPDLDGFRLCKLLKLPMTAGTDQIPVIMISSSYRDVLAEHVARKAQAYAYLKLPGDFGLVARTVELALHRLLPAPSDRQLLGHKGDVHVLSENDTLSHTIVTALELDDWRVQRFRSIEALHLAWQDFVPKVLFIDCGVEKLCDSELNAITRGVDRPAVIAILKRLDPEQILHLLEHEVDDYMVLPAESSRFVEVCREARLKYNFRDMHHEFDSQLVKLRAVSDYLDLVITNSHEAIFTCDLKATSSCGTKAPSVSTAIRAKRSSAKTSMNISIRRTLCASRRAS
jgi:DNA-binding response OmpR family regulator